MSQSLSKVLLHIVYSTKNRAPWLRDVRLRCELYAYNASILKAKADSPAVLINGMEDHVHILCELSRKIAIMDLIKVSKTETTKWLKQQNAELARFGWQNGYGVFSVSQSNVESVVRYIAGQAEHHRKTSFQDEFRALCRRHQIEYDERYVWD